MVSWAIGCWLEIKLLIVRIAARAKLGKLGRIAKLVAIGGGYGSVAA